jgi:hypothetical protein
VRSLRSRCQTPEHLRNRFLNFDRVIDTTPHHICWSEVHVGDTSRVHYFHGLPEASQVCLTEVRIRFRVLPLICRQLLEHNNRNSAHRRNRGWILEKCFGCLGKFSQDNRPARESESSFKGEVSNGTREGVHRNGFRQQVDAIDLETVTKTKTGTTQLASSR